MSIADLLHILTTVDDGVCVVAGDVNLEVDAVGEPGGQVPCERRSTLSRGWFRLPVQVDRNDREDVVTGRRFADTAIAGPESAIDLEVRRFFCDSSDCPKKIFAEQVEQLTFGYGRRTVMLQRLLQQVALALGGHTGARLAERLAAPVSGSTLLRLMRSMDLPDVPS